MRLPVTHSIRPPATPLDEVFRIVNEHTRKSVESPVAKVLREGTVAGLANHTILISRNGAEIPIDDSGAPIRDSQGALAAVVLVFRDISERKKAEEASLRLAAIVNSSDDAIVAQRLDGVLVSWIRRRRAQCSAYPAAEALGSGFSFLIPEGSAEIPTDVLDRIRDGESGVHYEAIRRRKDGSHLEVAASVSPIFDEGGAIVGASRICRDITRAPPGGRGSPSSPTNASPIPSKAFATASWPSMKTGSSPTSTPRRKSCSLYPGRTDREKLLARLPRRYRNLH